MNKLVWKLLRSHISVAQLLGFFFANLFGMFVVLTGVQFYNDIVPVFSAEDAFLGDNFLVVSKHISASSSISGTGNTFSQSDINEIKQQSFCSDVGVFHSSQYKVEAAMSVADAESFTTNLFFEAVPDKFVEVNKNDWHYNSSTREIPIILPRTYLALYNFGFAQTHGLPKMSDGLVGLIQMKIFINQDGHHDQYKGRVIGFSSRINTILVPEDFLNWSNNYYTPGQEDDPSRIIIKTNNTADERISQFMDSQDYEVEDNKLESGKMAYLLKIVTGLVLFVGLLISVLSFYILMLSIYLLVQKNTDKLENLLLIGYSPRQVALPYQLLTIMMNLVVLVLAFTGLFFVRQYYTSLIALIYPQVENGSMLVAILFGLALFALVSVLNVIAIRRKVMNIWKRKE